MEKDKKKQLWLILDMVAIVLMAASVVTMFILPATNYKFHMKTYGLTGSGLLLGRSIAGNSFTIKPVLSLWLVVVLMVAAIMSLLFLRNKKAKLAAELQAIAGIAGIIVPILVASKLHQTIWGVKGVSAQYGLYVTTVLSVFVTVFAIKKLSDHKVLCALDFMVLPGMIYLFINNYIPMFGLYIAFKKPDYAKGLWNSPWVGLKNFKSLFKTDALFRITRNTLLYNFVFIILGIVLGILVGICLAELTSKLLQKTYQTLILLPQLISYVIIAYIVYGFFSSETGFINNTILGGEDTINFYAEQVWWPFILTFINQWKMIGYNSIIFLASIVGIDRSLYEAAKVDGASKWKQIRYVTLPQLKPTVITLFVLQCGRIFYSDFGLFYQVPLDNGALYNVTDTVDTFVYRQLMVSNNISISSAASFYQAVVGFIIVMVVNLIVRKVDKENAMF